ncbi:centrosomal protein of 55 kDa-like isoform X2 [Egretta garzetta]|nr:centrosomal protein of 55 kDa-like isoform X2 [Egretta garzetta]
MGECSAGGTEDPAVLDSSYVRTTADIALGTPAVTGAGALPVAAAKQAKQDDSSSENEVLCLPEMHSEGSGELLESVLLPAADKQSLYLQSISEEQSNGALEVAGPKPEEDDDSTSVNELLSLVEVSALGRKELQLKQHASTPADCLGDKQRWVRQLQQELADALRKNSLAEASLEAKKRYCRDLQEQKLQLQKEVDRSKAKLQKLKEQHIQTECYARSLKNAIKNKERELTASRNLQALLLMSSGTVAIPELEERIQWLQAGKARLEATVQQQAKTIEALQKALQAAASAHNGLEDLRASFQATQTAKEHQHCQRGSESKEPKKHAKLKCQSEALLDEMRGRNIALEAERTRLKMLLEGCRTKLMAYAGRESQLGIQGEMKNGCSEVAN